MKTTTSILNGLWSGYFRYGQQFGDLQGQKVTFRITLQETEEGQFHGKCIELEGEGVNPEIANIRGYMEGNCITFVKEYPINYFFDEEGNLVVNKRTPAPLLTYFGEYNWPTKTFTGHWELEVNHGYLIDRDAVTVFTGTWEMSKVQ